MLKDGALQFWSGTGIDRFVAGPRRNGDILCCYAFYPAEKNDLREDRRHLHACSDALLDTFPDLDSDVRKLFLHAEDIKQWRLFIHPEYPYWQKGRACVLGDAGTGTGTVREGQGVKGFDRSAGFFQSQD